MSIYGTYHDIEIRRRVKVWEFPKSRFIEHEPCDESWCRPLGIGREVASMEVTTISNAYVSNVHDDGSVEFTSKGLAQ